MNKFNVGDRVRIKRKHSYTNNKTGTIVLQQSECEYAVRLDYVDLEYLYLESELIELMPFTVPMKIYCKNKKQIAKLKDELFKRGCKWKSGKNIFANSELGRKEAVFTINQEYEVTVSFRTYEEFPKNEKPIKFKRIDWNV